MARLLIYDAYENKVYTYNSLNENDPMPYSTERTLTLREFRGKSGSPVLCLPPHLGGGPRHPQPALRRRGL